MPRRHFRSTTNIVAIFIQLIELHKWLAIISSAQYLHKKLNVLIMMKNEKKD